MLDEVKTLAAMLQDFGVGKGDRVIIYMPMVPEAALSRMLACARIGAIHSVVFGGFAAKELATRIDDAKPKLILSACCGIEPGRDRPIQAAARRGDRAGAARSRRPASSCSGRRSRRALIEGRDHDWAALREAAIARERTARTACPCWRPIRSTSSTRPARPACRKASCATMAATWSR